MSKTLPYFDFIIEQLRENDSPLAKGFGKHVHWGYWADPTQSKLTHDDYYLAAKQLTTKMCEIGDIKDNQSILDVGCGFGGTIAELNENHSGMNLTGLNIDNRQLERARELVKPMSNNQINFIEGNACSLPFTDHQFDNILAVECIFHFPSRIEFFKHAQRVLKPGGSITISDFISHPLFLPSALIMKLPLVEKFSFFGACNIDYTLNRYQRLAKSFGLTMESYDISKNVAPTYQYLNQLAKAIPLKQPYKRMRDIFTGGMQLLSYTSLLTYQIVTFKKT